jgi:hypothetical protein
MSNNAHDDKAALEERFAEVFSHLREQDIEQFYAHYQLWVLRRRLPLLEKQLDALREHLAENQRAIESLRPSALALAVLVRLQSNGVNDTDVLDLMLDRGEDWLDRMMQRLDYCEQVEDFIQGDYTQWCVRSLEGAYDWIDSLLGSIQEDNGRREVSSEGDAATEELLLQKLRQDDEKAMLEITLKQPAIRPETTTEESSASGTVEGEHEPISATSEESATATQPDVSPEQQEESEFERQAELVGWKDLEDLEAPSGEPLPWYSVDVTANGTTAPARNAEQAASMDDWIKILQAETAEAASSTGTPEQAEMTAPTAPESNTASEIVEVPADCTATPAVTPEVAVPDNEQPGEPETPTLAENDQAGSTPVDKAIAVSEVHTGTDEAAHRQPSTAPETVPQEESLAATSHTIQMDETQLRQAPESESGTNAETMLPEEAEQKAGSLSPEALQNEARLEQADQEQEAERAAVQVPVNEFVGREIQHRPPSPAEARSENAASAAIESTKEAQLPNPEIEREPGEINEQKAEPEEQTQALPESASSAEQAPPISESVSETERAREQEHAQVPDAASVARPPENQEIDQARASDEDAQAHEIETAAIANDILSGEQGAELEQEEQLAWYEYLDLEEPANSVMQSGLEEHIEPEKGSLSPIDEGNALELHEYAAIDTSADEQSSAPAVQKGSEEIIESEDWQRSGVTSENEETHPPVLKDIQSTSNAQVVDPQANSLHKFDDHPQEKQIASELQVEDHARREGGNNVYSGVSLVEPDTATGHNGADRNAYQGDSGVRIDEQPTLLLDQAQIRRESTGAETTKSSPVIPHKPEYRQEVTSPEKPSQKISFWQRLFRFWGKKKQ